MQSTPTIQTVFQFRLGSLRPLDDNSDFHVH
jgi:hypothetical protein